MRTGELVGEAWYRGLDRHLDAVGPVGRAFDQPPAIRFLENLRGELGVERVTGAMGHEMADDRMTDERQVADIPIKRNYTSSSKPVMARLPGRDVTFAEVRDEIDRDLGLKPLSPIETNAYTLRWRCAKTVCGCLLHPKSHWICPA